MILIRSDPKAREKPCLRCGYSLRRIPDATHCPECGLSIWLSLNPNDTLDVSKPLWLGQLVAGAWLSIGAHAMGVIVLFVLLIGGWGYPARSPVTAVLVGVYLLLLGLGLAVFTTPEHRHPDTIKPIRLSARIVAACALAAGALFLALAVLRAVRWSGSLWQLVALAFLFRTVVLAASLATLACLRRYAARIPSMRAARLSGWLMLFPLVGLIRMFPLFCLTWTTELGILLEVVTWLHVPAVIAFLIWFARTAGRVREAAADCWARETAPHDPGHPVPPRW